MKNNTRNLEHIESAKALLDLAEVDLKHAVQRAYLDGASWAEIGAALGVSKQTAHNRYGDAAKSAEHFESGAASVTPEQAEIYLSSIFNPQPHIVINMKRDHGYRRTERQ